MKVESRHLLSGRPVSGSPIDFATAKRTPGVYRLQEGGGGAVVVVMRDSRILYVNSGYVADFPLKGTRTDQFQFWLSTDIEVPDEIIP